MPLKSFKEVNEEQTQEKSGEIVIKKFIVEYKLYPNGAMYPHKHYPIGSTVVRKKKKKRNKNKCKVKNEGYM